MAFKPIEILINAKDNASGVFSSLQGKVAAVGAAIAAYFGVSAFTGMVKGAADFEQAMSRVQAATGASKQEMAALQKAAEDVGAAGAYSSTEAAGALENLAKAGLGANDAIAALPAVLSLAQAGDVELAASAEYVTKAVAGMGLAFTDAARVADVLALGANATNTSVEGLAQALSYAAPVAQSANVSLEGTVALLGKLADAGIDASRSGTALSGILAQFSDPASAFKRELAAAGITTNDFEKALRQLAAAGPAGEKAILAVGLNAGPALRALLNQGMGALDELKVKLEGAMGSADEFAKVAKGNLAGSMTGLGNIWDAVKNKLATPVLPVLKEGVDQLAGAFRSAIADGSIARFGDAIAKAFQAGIKWVREFLGTVDFGALQVRMQTFAAEAGAVFTRVGEYATNAGNVVKLAYGVMSAGVNAVQTAIYGIGSVFAEVASTIMTGVAKLRDGLASVTFGGLSESFKLAAEDARNAAQGFSEAAQAMRDKAAGALKDTAAAAQLARDGYAGLAGATREATAATESWEQAVARAAAEIEATGKAQADAAAKTQQAKKAAEDNAAAASRSRQAIAELRAEYERLIASGNLQAAAEKLQEVNKRLRETPDAAQAAALALEGAFQNLGMQTTKDLNDAAAKTAAAWDTLTAQGVRSAGVLREAFAAYANAAMAAAERQGDAAVAATQRMLATKAAVAGLSLEVDRSGRVIVKSMGDAEEATHRVGRAASGAAGGYRDMAGAAALAAKNAEALQKIYDRHRLDDGKDKYTVGNGSDLVGNSRDIRYAGINDTDINQQIAQRYGDDAVDSDLARKAWQLRMQLEAYQKNYGNARSAQSLLEQRNIAAELERIERLLDEELLSQRGGNAGRGGRGAAPAPSSGSPGGGASSSRTGVGGVPAAGPTFNITLNANGVQDPVRLARLIEPELKRIAARAR